MVALEERPSRVWIENVKPQLERGQFPIKRTVAERVEVSADVFVDGHDFLCVAVQYKRLSESEWRESLLLPQHNDRWVGGFLIDHQEDYQYRICAWVDSWQGWLDGFQKKVAANQDVNLELLEGAQLILDCASLAPTEIAKVLLQHADLLTSDRSFEDKFGAVSDGALTSAMRGYQWRRDFVADISVFSVQVDRERARFGAWYEMFPRSTGSRVGQENSQGGTFRDAAQHLRYVAELGFDVVYLPPIHPIGITKRKGRNNSPTSTVGEPGSPWAIGNAAGGHEAIEPALGTLEDFSAFVEEAKRLGLEIALDLALQCSPDHPYVTLHPEWFRHRPDGTIHYAENPPKKYQDIYPFNFECAQWQSLWTEILNIVLLWVDRGVSIFRVDNPHTKPLPFWRWLLSEVRARHPHVLFLSEAFTRPKVMYALAKLGFHQSYTYFTWRNAKHELTEYLIELTSSEVREFFRPNFFANTPDILHAYLQHGGRAAFEIRAVLAATLGSTYGIYSGFELCENEGVPGTEEYMNSEKYEIRRRDWDAPGNIKALISQLNELRRANPALQFTNNLRFLEINNANLLAYIKHTDSPKNTIICCVNVDPHQSHDGMLYVPSGWVENREDYWVHDLLSGERYQWRGEWNYVRLDPSRSAVHVFRVEEWDQ